MFALRFASLFVLAATLATASPVPAPASPAVVNKRQSTASVTDILTTLQGSTGTILPQISSLSSSGTASDTTVAPLLAELTSALGIATASLAALPASSKRQTEDEVASAFAGVISEFATTFNGVSFIPGFGTLIIPVDTALNELLVALDVVLIGVDTLIAGILVSVAVLLEEVGLSLVVSTLGLGALGGL
ncbi:hypothetical protein B0H11DRAFT_2432558 [Mycena galericulata]|nr:hypothetical protein B0H11DRAFT_2432558 [Mycena galericulata]